VREDDEGYREHASSSDEEDGGNKRGVVGRREGEGDEQMDEDGRRVGRDESAGMNAGAGTPRKKRRLWRA
jgi:hypothetical protein